MLDTSEQLRGRGVEAAQAAPFAQGDGGEGGEEGVDWLPAKRVRPRLCELADDLREMGGVWGDMGR